MDLKSMISILYDMELNNFYMTNAISEMDKNMQKLGKRDPTKAVRNPYVGKEPFNEPLPYKDHLRRHSVVVTCFIIFFGILGLIIAFPIMVMVSSSGMGYMALILFLSIIIGLCVGWGLGKIVAWLKREYDYNKRCNYYNEKHDEYVERMGNAIQKDLQRVRIEAAMDSNRVKKELEKKKIILENRMALYEKKNDSENKLRTFYQQSGIDPKFQNLISMGYMYEFIRLGVATKLEGTDGLYYLIMKELRWDQMHNSLTTICDNLESVVDNQRMIYGELIAMRKDSYMMVERLMYGINNLDLSIGELKDVTELNGDRIINSLNRNFGQINDNLRGLKTVQEYGNERMARELEYQNYMAKEQNWVQNKMMKEQNDILKFGY